MNQDTSQNLNQNINQDKQDQNPEQTRDKAQDTKQDIRLSTSQTLLLSELEALAILRQTTEACESIRPGLKAGSAQYTLNTRRLAALHMSMLLIEGKMTGSALDKTDVDTRYSMEEIENASAQLNSIKRKSENGLSNARAGTAAHTRFGRIIRAIELALTLLQDCAQA